VEKRKTAGYADWMPRDYRSQMASNRTRPPAGLFDNSASLFTLDELADTVRALEGTRSGQTVDELSSAVFAELGMKRTQRASELVAEAIRMARNHEPRAEIEGSQWQASTAEVRDWARSAGFQLDGDGHIPGHAIAAYNQVHPDRPY
jgi:hypothetical protein